MQDIVATTVLVPEGWQVEGGITRPASQFYSMPVLLDVKFIAPDGRQARQFPSMSFEFNYRQPAQPFSPTSGGNMYLDLPQSPGAWLMDMSRKQPEPGISDLRLVSEAVVPDLTKQLQQNNAATYQTVQQSQAMAMQTGMSMQFDTQATAIVIQYTKDGRQLEETILMTWQYLVHLWQGQVTHGTWSIGEMRSLRGSVGSAYLNDPALQAIFQSARPNPVWVQEMNRYWSEIARILNKGGTDRRNQAWAAHQKRMQTMNETSDIIANGWKARNAISDAGHQRTIDSIHEVTPYQTPAGQTVKLPSFYDNVHTDNNGRYILHNDSYYEPNRDPTVNSVDWHRIEQQR